MTDHNNMLEEGIEAIRRGDKTTARSIFRSILDADPDNVQALLWLAGVAGSRTEKDRVLQQVLRVDPDNAVAQRGLDALSTSSTTPPAAPPSSAKRTPASVPVSAAEPNDEAAEPSGDPLERDVVVLGATANRPKRRKRRSGLVAWLPLILALFACGIGGVFVAQQTDWFDRLTGPRAAATATAEQGEAAAIITDTAVAADLGPVLGDATATAVAPGSALTSTTTINIPGVQAGASASGSAAPDASASALPEPSIVAAAPSGVVVPAPSGVVAPAPSGTLPAPSIVGGVPSVVPAPSIVAAVPSAVPAPSVVAVAPSGEAATSSGAPATALPTSPTASSVLPVPSVAASPAPGVVAAAPSGAPGATASSAVTVPATAANGVARPVVIDPKQHSIAAGTWLWSYFGLSNVTSGRGYSTPPSNGRYLIVLLVMQNLGTTPQQIPDGLYVVTDDQGRTIPFNRQASEEYFLQTGIGVSANYDPTAAIPPTESWVSVPLLFDVPPDATNLIVSSTSTPAQGYLVRQNMQQ